MADEILRCDGTDPVYEPNWDNIVGEKTLDSGGYVGDLLTLVRIHLEDAKDRGELREEDAGNAYAQAIIASMKDAIDFELQWPKASLELCYLQAQIDKLQCDCDNQTLSTASSIEVNNAQIEKMKCDCANDIDRTASTIALNAANENKLACDCCNNSKATESKILVDEAQIDKMVCECCNDTTATNSKVSLDRAQEEKLECDCTNEKNLAASKVQLTNKQIADIEYKARQKLYDAQLVAWAIVFQDADLDTVPSSLSENSIDKSYQEIVAYLAAT